MIGREEGREGGREGESSSFKNKSSSERRVARSLSQRA